MSVEDERLECQFHFLQAPEIDLPEATYENRLPDLCMNQRNDRYRADSIPSLIYRIQGSSVRCLMASATMPVMPRI